MKNACHNINTCKSIQNIVFKTIFLTIRESSETSRKVRKIVKEKTSKAGLKLEGQEAKSESSKGNGLRAKNVGKGLSRSEPKNKKKGGGGK